jgi:hypothetical protein
VVAATAALDFIHGSDQAQEPSGNRLPNWAQSSTLAPWFQQYLILRSTPLLQISQLNFLSEKYCCGESMTVFG